MFSKLSRYRPLPDAVTVDARGASAESKTLRLLPAVTGTQQHTVEETDRLDHLAYKYYRQTTRWWRICDANPEIESPLALLGAGPVVTYRFPLGTGAAGDGFPWSALRSTVTALVGVEDAVAVEEEIAPVTVTDENGRSYDQGRYRRTLVVRLNRLATALEEVSAAVTGVMDAAGLDSGQPAEIGRIGKPITIPPRPAGRRS